jgi:hypothetical protein
MPVIDPFLYIVLADEPGRKYDKWSPVEKTYDGTTKDVIDLIDTIFIVTQVAVPASGIIARIPWEIQEIPLNQITYELEYNSGIAALPDDPINVGRYDYTFSATYVRTSGPYSGTYKCYFSTNYNAVIPAGIPTPNIELVSFAPGPSPDPDFDNDTGLQYPEARINQYKYLIIEPAPLTITFTDTEISHTGSPLNPEYVTVPENVPIRLQYTGDNTLSPLAAPIKIGTYSVTAISLDFNYSGTQQAIFNIIPVSTTAAASIAAVDQRKIDILEVEVLPALYRSSTGSSSEKMTAKEFAQTGVLSILDETDIRGLAGAAVGAAGTVNAIADCAKNLPQKLMKAVVAKVAMFLLSYIPGLAIINLITKVLELIETIQKILDLIKFIKDNPFAFLNMVLEASGAYAAVGQLANDTVASLTNQFPAVTGAIGDVGGFVKGVANGAIDICNALDAAGSPISPYVKADNTKSPEAVIGFNPAVFRQPLEAKAKYDQFQLQIRGSLNKDNDKLNTLRNEGDEIGLYEYASMLTSVHELAYNYHDQVASRGGGTGLMTGNSLSSSGLDSDSLYDMLGEAAGTIAALTPAGSSSTNSGLSSSINAASNAIGGVTAGASAVGNFLVGGNIASLAGLKSAFNFAVKDTLTKNPTWSSETINDYNKRVNAIKGDIESNADAIQNNPANLTLTPAAQISSSSSSSPSSSSSLTASLSKSSPLFASIVK